MTKLTQLTATIMEENTAEGLRSLLSTLQQERQMYDLAIMTVELKLQTLVQPTSEIVAPAPAVVTAPPAPPVVPVTEPVGAEEIDLELTPEELDWLSQLGAPTNNDPQHPVNVDTTGLEVGGFGVITAENEPELFEASMILADEAPVPARTILQDVSESTGITEQALNDLLDWEDESSWHDQIMEPEKQAGPPLTVHSEGARRCLILSKLENGGYPNHGVINPFAKGEQSRRIEWSHQMNSATMAALEAAYLAGVRRFGVVLRHGITLYLGDVWPAFKRRHPDVTLSVMETPKAVVSKKHTQGNRAPHALANQLKGMADRVTKVDERWVKALFANPISDVILFDDMLEGDLVTKEVAASGARVIHVDATTGETTVGTTVYLEGRQILTSTPSSTTTTTFVPAPPAPSAVPAPPTQNTQVDPFAVDLV